MHGVRVIRRDINRLAYLGQPGADELQHGHLGGVWDLIHRGW